MFNLRLTKTLKFWILVSLGVIFASVSGFWLTSNFLKNRFSSASAATSGNAYTVSSYNSCSYNGTSCGLTQSGLQLWYDADSTTSYPGTGQIIYDLSGNAKHGTLGLNSSVADDDPAFNSSGVKSFQFINAREVINTNLMTNFSTNFSFEVWFKRSSNNSAVASCERLITMVSNVTNAARANLAICGKTIAGRGRTTDNTNVWIKDTGFIANTEWQMGGFSYDTTTQAMQVYVNGALHSTSTQAILSGTDQPAYIGASYSGINQSNFLGDMAIVRIYNRALTETEITNNFNSEKSRFGFTATSSQITLPITLNIGSQQVKNTAQQINITLPNIAITDRRANFTTYNTTLSITDLTDGSKKITKENISVNFGLPTNEIGSGINNSTGSGGSLSTPKTLMTNSASNGGGKFVYSPQVTVTVPAFSQQGAYTATITVTIN